MVFQVYRSCMGNISKDCPDQRGFSRTILSDQCNQISTVNMEVYVMQNDLFADVHTNVIDFDAMQSTGIDQLSHSFVLSISAFLAFKHS